VMCDDEAVLARERAALRAVLTPNCFVDVASVIAAFNVVDRVADATGIPLDDMLLAASADLREQLGLSRFASAANTPGGRCGQSPGCALAPALVSAGGRLHDAVGRG